MHSNSQALTRRFQWEWRWLLSIWLAIGALLMVLLWLEHGEIKTNEGKFLEHEARMLQETLALQLGATNRALDMVIADLQRWQALPDRLERANRRLQALPGAVLGMHSIALLDARGTVIASSDRKIIGRDFSNRSYYRTARQTASPATLIVSPPYRTDDDSWVIALARIVHAPDGEFGGVVAATLDSTQLLTLLQQARHSPDMIVSLLHGDGLRFLAVIGNEPTPTEYGVNLAQPDSLFLRHRESGQENSLLLGVRLTSGAPNLMALRNIQPPGLQMDNPLVIAVGHDWRAMFADWRRKAGFLCGVHLLIGMLAAFGLRYLQRHQRQIWLQETELAAQATAMEVRWRAVLEATNQGVWDWDARTDKIYFSPVWKSMLGYAEDEIGDTLSEWESRLHPEDRESVLADVRRHLDGKTAYYENVHRVACKDGGYKWILDRGRIIERDAQGKPVRLIGTHTDVTESRRQKERLDRLAESLPGALYQYLLTADGHSRFPYVSKGIQNIYGYSPEELQQDASLVFERIHPDDLARVRESIEHSARTLNVWRIEYRVILPELGERWISGLAQPQPLEAGEILWHGYIHDVTEAKQQALQLQETERLLQHLMDEMPIGLCMVDAAGNIYYRNKRFETLFGYTYADVPTLEQWWLKAYPDPAQRAQISAGWTAAVAQAAETGQDIPTADYPVTTREGVVRTVGIGGITFGNRFLATFVDNTEQQAQRDRLHELAYMDGLTGVANRRHFDQTLQSEWQHCRRNGLPLALLMIDIDHFKHYNDSYGHQQGDACLQAVASVLRAGFNRPHDLVARYGGEEFVCLMPDGDSSPQTLLTRADANLYRAKEKGRNRVDDGTDRPS